MKKIFAVVMTVISMSALSMISSAQHRYRRSVVYVGGSRGAKISSHTHAGPNGLLATTYGRGSVRNRSMRKAKN